METKEQKLDREFDELNEGLMAMQIMEWFERTNPQPYLHPDHPPEPGSELDEEWNAWSMKLCYYADGWKDALKALQWRKQWEKDDLHIDYMLTWFENYPKDILWWRHQNMLDEENIAYLRDCEGFEGVLWCEMLPVDIDEEDWDYREP